MTFISISCIGVECRIFGAKWARRSGTGDCYPQKQSKHIWIDVLGLWETRRQGLNRLDGDEEEEARMRNELVCKPE